MITKPIELPFTQEIFKHVLAKLVFLWSNSDIGKIPFMKQLWQFNISLKSYSVLVHDKLTGSITTNLPIRGQLD